MITYKRAKRIVIALIGGTVVFIGLALLVLPGPAFIVLPAGLAILATEFEFARRWLHYLRDRINGSQKKNQKPAPEVKV